jgi:GT2 family glycosyltransferase
MSKQNDSMLLLGVVVIGRNEGERLRRCLESVQPHTSRIMYVDSGSTDGSVDMVRSKGVEVVQLDIGIPFTAARARNQGFQRLRELCPGLSLVQFVDGDCEVSPNWLAAGAAFLDERPEVAVVCGRLREKFPERSVYNMLCDIEWDGDVGETPACGGIAMMRAEAFEAVGGFRADLIAGEEPELCVRMRKAGWRIWRLETDMALHDAAMTRFGQWWKRALRAGFAFAQRAYLHGAPPEREGVRESRSAWFWGFAVPFGVCGLALWTGPQALLLLLVYPAQVVRLAFRGRRSPRENWWHAWFLVLGKFPEMFGQVKFFFHRFVSMQSGLIEHK